MMLAAPAKLGVPYEIGLKSINLACATLMIWLLEFKTKLPEPFKVILPFSYFLCYQYGVAPLCADGRRHAAGGYQLENPRRETMARSAQHDAAVPDQFIWTGNRQHVRGELGSAVRPAGTLADT